MGWIITHHRAVNTPHGHLLCFQVVGSATHSLTLCLLILSKKHTNTQVFTLSPVSIVPVVPMLSLLSLLSLLSRCRCCSCLSYRAVPSRFLRSPPSPSSAPSPPLQPPVSSRLSPSFLCCHMAACPCQPSELTSRKLSDQHK